jgi:hypothetical protein
LAPATADAHHRSRSSEHGTVLESGMWKCVQCAQGPCPTCCVACYALSGTTMWCMCNVTEVCTSVFVNMHCLFLVLEYYQVHLLYSNCNLKLQMVVKLNLKPEGCHATEASARVAHEDSPSSRAMSRARTCRRYSNHMREP